MVRAEPIWFLPSASPTQPTEKTQPCHGFLTAEPSRTGTQSRLFILRGVLKNLHQAHMTKVIEKKQVRHNVAGHP